MTSLTLCQCNLALDYLWNHVKSFDLVNFLCVFRAAEPSFIVTPRDTVVGVGRRATFRCEVTGSPVPAVFWNKATSHTLMFPNQDNGRMSVSENGTLTIESVQWEDDGEYICKGLSIAGSAVAKARLDVTGIVCKYICTSVD
jgi:Immunoglobulin I-set domain